MRILLIIGALTSGIFLLGREASAAVDIHVDLSTQTLRASDRGQTYVWPVSTARSGYVTPRGVYRPTSLQVMHYSRKYDMSPMPHSIFFKGGYAIHGSYETASIGRPASHGCIRLSPAHAAQLYRLVQQDGARISISGAPPRTLRTAERVRRARPIASRYRADTAPYAPAAPVYYYYGGYSPQPYSTSW
jgi:hypothetical protein